MGGLAAALPAAIADPSTAVRNRVASTFFTVDLLGFWRAVPSDAKKMGRVPVGALTSA
jgi:hypothetical protein